MKSEYISEYISTDGKFVTYQVRVPVYRDGKRQFYSQSFSSKRYGSKKLAKEEAIKFRDKMKYQTGTLGIDIKPQIITADEMLERKFALLPKSKETERKHRIYFNKHIKPFVEGIAFDKIKASHIQESLNAMVSSCSTDTINRVFGIWKDLYKAAIIDEVVFLDHTLKVIVPCGDKIVKKRNVETNREKLEEVCERILNGHYHDKEIIVKALWTMYYAGLRPNEAYALRWNNIDQVNGTITICQTIGSTTESVNVIRKTKNENSVRTIPYPPILNEIWKGCGDDYLFVKANGKFLNGNTVSDILKRASNGSFTSYMLRKLFATDLIKEGVDLKTVQSLMGHVNGSTTLGYARTTQEQMKEAINKRK